jgi:NADH-quinone oxidoreductase subunit G
MATIEIDGQTLEVNNGKMIIEAADDAGIYIPRFCYHKKLSVAANCRMCLVEVENNRKTVPACATPVSDGMKVFTKSPAAVKSQQIVMDFLLINHPLDCPICDQGGECELQDVSMGFGRDVSEYEESKRAVVDDNLGQLIATEMTRCIHCTRCVRFGDEIAGVRELGGLGRGEEMQIGTYVEHSLRSEVSGNIIDLCPVGALTSKPARFTARAWELQQYDSIATHDCLGSNIHVHVRRNELMRVVPKENETINETWLSDRDRFSYLGVKHSARLAEPMIKKDGQWVSVDWQTALTFAANGISKVIKQHGVDSFAALASSSSTVEEFYLLQKLMRALGVNHVDHRLQQTDFRDQHLQPNMPKSSLSYAELEQQRCVLIVGSNLNREVPLAAVRVRKAVLNGAQVFSLNPVDYVVPFDVTASVTVAAQDLVWQLASLLLAVVKDPAKLSTDAQKLLIGLKPDATICRIAEELSNKNAVIVTGAIYANHPNAAILRTLTALIAQHSGAKTLHLTFGANSAGGWLAGMVPHRTAAGQAVEKPGMDVQSAIDAKLKGYFLLGTEPDCDISNPYGARQAMLAAECVVAVSAYQTAALQEYADVILPMAAFAETSGTFINIDGTWQTVRGALKPYGGARPAWKILRVLGNILHCDGFEYNSSDDVLQELKVLVENSSAHDESELFFPDTLPAHQKYLTRVGEWPLYRCDMLVRHANALQNCASADSASIHIHPDTADHYKLNDIATVSQGDIEITLPVIRNKRIAPDSVWVQNALPETVDLGHAFAKITIRR